MGPWDFGVSRIIVMVIYGYEYHIYIYINNSSNEHEMWFQNFSAWCLAWCHHWKHQKPTLEALMTISNTDTKPIDITVPALRVQCCFITSSKLSSVKILAKPLSQPFRAVIFWRISHFYEILPLIIWSSLVVIQSLFSWWFQWCHWDSQNIGMSPFDTPSQSPHHWDLPRAAFQIWGQTWSSPK